MALQLFDETFDALWYDLDDRPASPSPYFAKDAVVRVNTAVMSPRSHIALANDIMSRRERSLDHRVVRVRVCR